MWPKASEALLVFMKYHTIPSYNEKLWAAVGGGQVSAFLSRFPCTLKFEHHSPNGSKLLRN